MIVVGVGLLLFGGAASWLLATRFAEAICTRIGYGSMMVSGVLVLAWAFSAYLPLGIGSVLLLGIGGAFGVVGAFRKELRVEPPA